MSRRASATCALSATTAVAIMAAPAARADDKRLNDGVVANVYTVQRQAGCTNDVTINPQLQLGRPMAHPRSAEQPAPQRRHRF